jgi:hypothetical protein
MEVSFRNPLTFLMRKIGFRFDLTAWVILSEATQSEYGQWSDLPENQFTTALFYGAYCSYCNKYKVKRKYDLHDIYRLKRYWDKHNPERVLYLKNMGVQTTYMGKLMTEAIADFPKGEKKNT